MAETLKHQAANNVFGLRAASRLMLDVVAPWVQDLGLLVEGVESARPAGAGADWQPGAVLRLPFSKKHCGDGAVISGPALLALADTAMMFACSAAWNGYRPMTAIDQTTHFLRPASFDVLADARIIRVSEAMMFGRAMLINAADRRPVGMVSSAYAMQ